MDGNQGLVVIGGCSQKQANKHNKMYIKDNNINNNDNIKNNNNNTNNHSSSINHYNISKAVLCGTRQRIISHPGGFS